MHRISQEDVERTTFAFGLLLASFEQVAKFNGFTLELSEYLQTVVMIAHVLLVDDEHGQQKVEQVADKHRRPVLELASQAFVEDLMKEKQNLAFK